MDDPELGDASSLDDPETFAVVSLCSVGVDLTGTGADACLPGGPRVVGFGGGTSEPAERTLTNVGAFDGLGAGEMLAVTLCPIEDDAAGIGLRTRRVVTFGE